jgi:hypothetical protein
MLEKKHYLKNYYKNNLKHLFTSKFIYDCVNEIPKIESLRLFVESNDIKKTHYLAVYLLSKGFTPYVKRFNKKKGIKFGQSPKTNKFFFIDIKKYAMFSFFSFFFNKLSNNNLATEQSPFFLKKNQTKVVLWNTPLVEEIKKLQSQQGYISNIPLGFLIKLSKNNKNTMYERAFLLRLLGFISFREIQDLDKI